MSNIRIDPGWLKNHAAELEHIAQHIDGYQGTKLQDETQFTFTDSAKLILSTDQGFYGDYEQVVLEVDTTVKLLSKALSNFAEHLKLMATNYEAADGRH